MSSINTIKHYNHAFIERLVGNENLGVDEKGRLYVIKESPLTALFHTFFKKPPSQLGAIAVEYALETFKQKEFHHIEKGPVAYQHLQKRLASIHLVTPADQKKIADAWYKQRYQDLLHHGLNPKEADTIISQEQSEDIHLLK